MTILKRKEIRAEELLFCLAVALYVAADTLCGSMFSLKHANLWAALQKLVHYGCYGLCALKIVCSGYRRKAVVPFVLLAVIFAIELVKGDSGLFTLFFFMVAAYEIGSERYLTWFVVVKAALLALIILSAYLGIVENYVFDPDTRVRYGMGFTWTTVAPITFMFLVFAYSVLRKGNYPVWQYGLFLLLAVWFYVCTNTRMAFALTVLFLVVLFFESRLLKQPWYLLRKLKWANCLWPLLIGCATLLLFYAYNADNAVWQKLNSLLSSRLSYSRNALDRYAVTLFGQKIEWVGKSLGEITTGTASDDFVDSSYLRYLLKFGITGYLALTGIYSFGIYRAVKKDDYCLVFTYVTVLLFCVTEMWLMNIAMNPFFLLAFTGAERSERLIRFPVKQKAEAVSAQLTELP